MKKQMLFGVVALVGLVGAARPSMADAPQPKSGDLVIAMEKPNNWIRARLENKLADGMILAGFNEDYALSRPPTMLAIDKVPSAKDVKVGSRVVVILAGGKFEPGMVHQILDKGYAVRLETQTSKLVPLKDLRLIGARSFPNRLAKKGDRVIAQWTPNDWYEGKVGAVTALGLTVLYDDGDKAALHPALVAVDRVPNAKEFGKLTRVLAKRKDGKYYPGTATAISGNNVVSVSLDDGIAEEFALKNVRLLNQ